MSDRGFFSIPGGIPAELKTLETIINEMHGQKRGYVVQKIKHYQGLLRNDNDVVLMQTLTELNSDLTMSPEEQWLGQPLGMLVPEILNCMDLEFLPEVMMLSCTVLNNVLEVCPEACATIVENNGLDRLGLKLLNNDLTESIISSLEKISHEYSNVILQSGVLEMLMNVIDFLIVQSQVSILRIVARIFKAFSDKDNDLETKILPVLPKVKEVLLNSDKTEEVAIEIYLNLTKRIYKLYENNRDLMETKINQVALHNETVPFLVGLAEKALNAQDSRTHQNTLHLFTIFNKFAFMSADLSKELLLLRIDTLILKTLSTDSPASLMGEDSKILMNEIISFINTLLSLNNYQNDFFHKIFGLAGIEILKHHNTDKKVKFIEDNQELVRGLLGKIVQDCAEVFEASEDFFFKYLFLTALRKIVMFLDEVSLREFMDISSFVNFLSKTLDSHDIIVVVIALFIIQSVVTKLPDIKKGLVRHGLIGFLKKLTQIENLDTYIVPEVCKKNQPGFMGAMSGLHGLPDLDKKKGAFPFGGSKDRDELMQQLISWQKNPKLFIEGMQKLNRGDKAGVRERVEGEEPEEGEEEQHEGEGEEDPAGNIMIGEGSMQSSQDNSTRKEVRKRKGTEGVEEAEADMESESTKRSEVEQLGGSLLLEEGMEEIPNLKTHMSLSPDHPLKNFDIMENELGDPLSLNKSQTVVLGTASGQSSAKKEASHPLSVSPTKHQIFGGSIPKEPKPQIPPPVPEYTIQNAREDLAKLATETLEKVGTDLLDDSVELMMLTEIKKKLEEKNLEGLKLLSQFFLDKHTLTYFEYTKANFIKPIVDLFLADSNHTEDVSRFLKAYYEALYKEPDLVPISELYANLLDFLGRLSEASPFLSNDQLARTSFVKELKFLSTPLKIKVNFNQSLSKAFSKDDFFTELTTEFPHLESSTKDGLYADVHHMLKLFKETFLKQNSIWLQVERFASLKSVEVYLVDKFSTKALTSNEEFNRKRIRESEEGALMAGTGAVKRVISTDHGEHETILTSGYLEKRLEEQINFGKEKDIRRYFEKQYIRKPSKLIGIKFELRIQKESGEIIRKPITSQTTLHELVSIISKEVPKKNLGTIELDYSIEIKTDIYHRGPKVRQVTPEHKSSLSVLYNDAKTRLLAIDTELHNLGTTSDVSYVIMGLKLISELDNLKVMYIEGPSCKILQQVQLDPGCHGNIQKKLVYPKLSTIYTKLLTKPSKILGQSFPLLCKLLCSQLPELFDFTTRYNFFKHLRFEPTRAMYFIYQANKPAFKEIPSSKIGKLKRKKLKVNRDKILEGAKLTFSISDFQSNVLEFDFEEEEGSGLGPTLEFYSLLAEDFKKQGPKMWRETNDFSYFPKPFDPKQTDQKKITEELNAWKILGAICGRSILDERLFDMRFSEVFWKVVMGKKVGLADIGQMNDSLMKTLSDMQQLANQYQLASNKLIGKTSDEMEKVKKSLKYNGVPVEDLCLLFTLPGYDDYELLPQGNKKEVNLDSLELYVDLVTKIYLVDSILPYVEAFREGISMFVSLNKLVCFLPSEMELVVCGTRVENWTLEYLKENIVPLHGYSAGSQSFLNFLEVLSEFTEEQKREFLMFAIGAPRLPLGGLKNLSPRLTVVKKHPHNERQSADSILPSVMTCQNYIKLPDYSSKDVLKKKLSIAIKEGQKSFTLS